MKIKEIIKLKLKDDSITDAIIDLSLLEATEYVKEHCNLNAIPDNLSFKVADIAIDLINIEFRSNTKTVEKEVKSISRGDTSITYTDKPKEEKKEDMFKRYHRDLNKYRKLRW